MFIFGKIYGILQVEENDKYKFIANLSNLIIESIIWILLISFSFSFMGYPAEVVMTTYTREIQVMTILMAIAYFMRRIYAVANNKSVSPYSK